MFTIFKSHLSCNRVILHRHAGVNCGRFNGSFDSACDFTEHRRITSVGILLFNATSYRGMFGLRRVYKRLDISVELPVPIKKIQTVPQLIAN